MIHLEGLKEENNTYVRLIEYDIQYILKQIEHFRQSSFHFQMIGILIIFGAMPLLTTFHLSDKLSFIHFLLISSIVIGIGASFILVFYNAPIFSKLDKRYGDLIRITSSLLNLKSAIYGYYVSIPDNEFVFQISIFQGQYYYALIILTLDSFKEISKDISMKKSRKEYQEQIDIITKDASIKLENIVKLDSNFDKFTEEINKAKKSLTES